jgi:hypothetical protein
MGGGSRVAACRAEPRAERTAHPGKPSAACWAEPRAERTAHPGRPSAACWAEPRAERTDHPGKPSAAYWAEPRAERTAHPGKPSATGHREASGPRSTDRVGSIGNEAGGTPLSVIRAGRNLRRWVLGENQGAAADTPTPKFPLRFKSGGGLSKIP